MDGVIVNSEPLHVEAWVKTAEPYGIELKQEMLETFRGLRLQEVAALILSHFPEQTTGVSAERLMKKKNIRLSELSRREAELIPGVRAFLALTRASYPQVALATACDPEIQQIFFEKFSLDQYFDVMVTGGDVTRGKPDPEIYLTTLSRLQLPADACFVIEDAVNGVRSAKAAGCYTIGITTSVTRDALSQAGADLIVDQFKEIELLVTGY